MSQDLRDYHARGKISVARVREIVELPDDISSLASQKESKVPADILHA